MKFASALAALPAALAHAHAGGFWDASFSYSYETDDYVFEAGVDGDYAHMIAFYNNHPVEPLVLKGVATETVDQAMIADTFLKGWEEDENEWQRFTVAPGQWRYVVVPDYREIDVKYYF